MTASRSTATRLLHLLLLVTVLHQLASSQFIHRPHPGEAPSTLWLTHQYFGVAALATVAAFWVWTLLRHRETPLGALLPWFSAPRLRALAGDMVKYAHGLLRGRLVDDRDSPLAEAVHGSGLLVASVMTISETMWLLSTGGTPSARNALIVHGLFGNLMWAYLVAHAGLAVLHYLTGSDIFSRMFLRRNQATAE